MRHPDVVAHTIPARSLVVDHSTCPRVQVFRSRGAPRRSTPAHLIERHRAHDRTPVSTDSGRSRNRGRRTWPRTHSRPWNTATPPTREQGQFASRLVTLRAGRAPARGSPPAPARGEVTDPIVAALHDVPRRPRDLLCIPSTYWTPDGDAGLTASCPGQATLSGCWQCSRRSGCPSAWPASPAPIITRRWWMAISVPGRAGRYHSRTRAALPAPDRWPGQTRGRLTCGPRACPVRWLGCTPGLGPAGYVVQRHDRIVTFAAARDAERSPAGARPAGGVHQPRRRTGPARRVGGVAVFMVLECGPAARFSARLVTGQSPCSLVSCREPRCALMGVQVSKRRGAPLS